MNRLWRAGGLLVLLLLTGAILYLPPRTQPIGSRTDFPVRITFAPIDGAELSEDGPFRLAGAWDLTGDAPEFHSLSGLAIAPSGSFLAVSDRGVMVAMPRPDVGKGVGMEGRGEINALQPDGRGGFVLLDAEAVVLDHNGTVRIVIENRNEIRRLANAARQEARSRPEAMAGWTATRGPESLARLADGTFIVLGEGREKGRDGTFPALVFEGDPAAGTEPWLFHLALPGGMRPVDAVGLSDGRMLVLGRSFGPLFQFGSAIYVVDMDRAGPATKVVAKLLGRIGGPDISDNFEGMAVEEAPDGRVTIWLVSDNNDAQVIQRTILLKLETRKSALR
ncbi:esterase-like activity of phytase family protein [Croceicoccus bisphenolivorans]|uniref:esterase-like activity of phytase family protein n=1 Tax=Croceicoccus bisphenolivorans TaxID=1783232 RepID=UPI00083209EC|nr:esterase-like activity of phytase family protein [Croceicoccus bisphenolivorans]